MAAPPVPNPAIPSPAPPGVRIALPVSFSNPIALRVAFMMSLITMLLNLIPVVQLLSPIWWLAAGSSAVMLYRRLTGMPLSVGAGARLGSITGVLAFLSLVILTALAFAFTGKELVQEMVRQNPQLSPVLNDPPMLAGVVAVAMVVLFAMVVGICAAGGALGARLANRNAKV